MVLAAFREQKRKLMESAEELEQAIGDLGVDAWTFHQSFPEVAAAILRVKTITVEALQEEEVSDQPTPESTTEREVKPKGKKSLVKEILRGLGSGEDEIDWEVIILSVLPRCGIGITEKTIKERLLAKGESFKDKDLRVNLNRLVFINVIKRSGDRYRCVY